MIITATSLTPNQCKDIQSILQGIDPLFLHGLDYPFFDEDALHFIYYQDLLPTAVLVLLHIKNQSFEVLAFTHKSFENRGYFQALLSHAQKKHPIDQLTWILAKISPKTKHLLKKFSAQYLDTEYTMERSLSSLPNRPSTYHLLPFDDQKDKLYEVWDKEKFIARYGLFPLSQSHCFLYDFFVFPEYRHRGIGQNILAQILKKMQEAGFTHILLHVSQSNEIACHLYLKQHFVISTSLYYYASKIERTADQTSTITPNTIR